MRIKETKVYTFDELSDEAKEKARGDWRNCGLDYEWWDCLFDDAVQVAECLGIEIARRAGVNSVGRPTPSEPKIFFSGFCSQGDGASFEGGYRYRKGWRKALKAYAPTDTELAEIGQALQEAQRPVKWTGSASVGVQGIYSHSGCMNISVNMETEWRDETESIIEQCLRDFADWIYARLRTEYEWMNSDEQVDEVLVANEYEFEADGSMA